MDLRSSSITADILNILSDCKVHTMNEMAQELDVHRNTVAKHIQSLSFRYPIQTFSGGINRGGVILDKNYLYQGKTLTIDELQIINQALTMLQNSKGIEVNTELLSNLINRFSPPSKEEQIV